MSNNEKMKELAKKALDAKERALGKGGFTPVPHTFFRDNLPELRYKYDGQTARDAFILFLYLSSYVNGESDKETFMWAFPSVSKIHDDTGIHKDRIKKLCDILESEKLLETIRIPWNGNTKKVFLPILP